MNEQKQLEDIKEWHENDGELHQFQIDFLIQQAEEKIKLQEHVEKSANFINQVELEIENERYKQALEFYADENNYDYANVAESKISSDNGGKARFALAGDTK